jgi:hypothetical protein
MAPSHDRPSFPASCMSERTQAGTAPESRSGVRPMRDRVSGLPWVLLYSSRGGSLLSPGPPFYTFPRGAGDRLSPAAPVLRLF